MALKLSDILRRNTMPEPWLEGERIPWDDADFSQRMLKEHLSQDHDLASRRYAEIERQVIWIHRRILLRKPSRILDLGCGPGLYTSRLAKLGHECTGIDFAPAAVEYAEIENRKHETGCRYLLGDIRETDYGSGYGMAMMIFGQINVFKPRDIQNLLRKTYRALAEGGIILLEAHTFAAVQGGGERQTYWFSEETGLFSEQPHLCLGEKFWDEAKSTAVERYYVISAKSGEVKLFSASMQAYTDEEYVDLLESCGFRRLEFYPSLGGEAGNQNGEFLVIAGRK